jgi:hypothetical protein
MSFFGFLFIVIVAMVYGVQQYTIWTLYKENEYIKKYYESVKPPF